MEIEHIYLPPTSWDIQKRTGIQLNAVRVFVEQDNMLIRREQKKHGIVERFLHKTDISRTKGGGLLSLKEEMAKHRKYEDLLKDQSPERTWSMDKPAYCYTPACPDPKLRAPIWRRNKHGI